METASGKFSSMTRAHSSIIMRGIGTVLLSLSSSASTPSTGFTTGFVTVFLTETTPASAFVTKYCAIELGIILPTAKTSSKTSFVVTAGVTHRAKD